MAADADDIETLLKKSNEENLRLRQVIEMLTQENSRLLQKIKRLEKEEGVAGSSGMRFFTPNLGGVLLETSALIDLSEKANAESEQLQNMLIDACYAADTDEVKNLVEKKGASLTLPNTKGITPIAAAIWGFAFTVLEYLESKVGYQEKDWINTAKIIQKAYGTLISFTRNTATFEDLVAHYDSTKQKFLYDKQALETRQQQAQQCPYLGVNAANLRTPLHTGKIVNKVYHKLAVPKKHGQLLEIHTLLKGKDKIIHYEWGAKKELSKLAIARQGGSIYLIWQLSDIMSSYLYNKGIKLGVDYTREVNCASAPVFKR